MKLLSILLVELIIFIFCGSLETVLVNTSVGQIRGLRMSNFTSFLGIPYGTVNHNNPFAPAEPYPVFKTTYDAFQIPVLCAQVYKNVPTGSLDCLNLNVYIPNNKIHESLPVMVFIHGGAFFEGSGTLDFYSPIYLVQNGVIVVTMNYRLGPYGFLCLKQTQYYNNQGFNDQKLALQWVRNNIGDFRGDAHNVVLFGHSSGSITVNYHLIYNNDLFNKVILQSGLIASPVNYDESELGFEIAKKLEINVDNNGNVDDFIKNLSSFKTQDLIKIALGVTSRRICLKDVQKESLRNLKNIKMLIGNTGKETGMQYGFGNEEFFKKFDFKTALKRGFYNVTDEMIKEIKAFYCNNEIKEDIIDLTTDFLYIYPVERTIKLHLEHGATVYRYLFTFNGHRNAMKVNIGLNYTGAVHADELGYLFDIDIVMNLTTLKDKYMIDELIKIWTDFAKYGYPLDRETGYPYPATNMITKPYILLDLPVRIRYRPYKSRMEFWDKFYNVYGRYSKGFDYFNSLAVESKARNNFASQIIAVSLILIYVLL